MSSAAPGSFHRSFRPEVGVATAARRALDDLCANVDDDLLDRSSLALSEVVTNSVEHARLGPSQLIDVEVALLTSLLRIEVIDDGVGLWLVDQLADRWGVDCSHSTRVWLEFDRDPS